MIILMYELQLVLFISIPIFLSCQLQAAINSIKFNKFFCLLCVKIFMRLASYVIDSVLDFEAPKSFTHGDYK